MRARQVFYVSSVVVLLVLGIAVREGTVQAQGSSVGNTIWNEAEKEAARPRYEIVQRGGDIDTAMKNLVSAVNAEMTAGWKPLGAPVIVVVQAGREGSAWVYQSMVR
jgi:hypothetical protein